MEGAIAAVRRPKARAAAIALSLLVAGVVSSAPEASGAEELTLISQTQVTLPVAQPPRTATDYTFQTSALASPTTVRVLLPRNYQSSGSKRYPVLYLLHGGAANYRSWSSEGGIVQAQTDGLDLIVVMPDAGNSAWYTDWYNNGRGGTPMWETYHIRQLIPWIDANFRTVASRSGRAIAGLSSGGFGTMSYASRNPDLFVAAAAFSGALDTNTPPVVSGKVIDALAAQDGGVPGSLFGLRETEEVRWRGSNPWDLAENLRGMTLSVAAGDAFPGGGGPEPPWDFGGRFLERATYAQSVSFHRRLQALEIPHIWDDYGPGSHNFYYWNRELGDVIPVFMQTFAENRPDPSPFSYRSIAQSYQVYGWSVEMNRGVVEFSSIEDVTAEGFRLTGSGSATVRTPPVYEPGRTYEVTSRSGSGESSETVTAGSDRRLQLQVDLGPANLTQQYFTPSGGVDPLLPDTSALPPLSPATTVHSTEVAIEGAETDEVPPAIEIAAPGDGQTFVLNEAVQADYSCSDEGSGVESCEGPVPSGQSLDTSSAGEHEFTVVATDRAGNTTTATHRYRVVYETEAFLAPVQSPPALNSVSANRAVPLKWRLKDAAGDSYRAHGDGDVRFTWRQFDCDDRTPIGEPSQAAATEGLSYDEENDHYVWKTRSPQADSGTCHRLRMKLDDGTSHAADFVLR